MDHWIKSNYDFGSPWAIFTVPVRSLVACKILNVIKTSTDIQGIETGLLELIRFNRPDLAGGVLVSIDMSRGGLYWRLGYIHPSLKKIQDASIPEERPLLEEFARIVEVTPNDSWCDAPVVWSGRADD